MMHILILLLCKVAMRAFSCMFPHPAVYPITILAVLGHSTDRLPALGEEAKPVGGQRTKAVQKQQYYRHQAKSQLWLIGTMNQ